MDASGDSSPFLKIPQAEWTASNSHAFAIRDRYPVTDGHTLVITKRRIATWFDASEEERLAILSLIDEVKARLDTQAPKPDGYNVGFNAGEAAGQTVMHLHVHVIPRYRGDMDDPRGGVRHVIPSRGNYLRDDRPLATGGDDNPFFAHLSPLFATANEIAILAAFVQDSGLEEIQKEVDRALQSQARVRILTGDYLDITQASALEMLIGWQETAGGRLEARIVESSKIKRAFHPKSWRFEATSYGIAFVGSSNLSRSALRGGIEWNVRIDRDRDARAYKAIHSGYEKLWSAARALDSEWVADYALRARRTRLSLPPGEQEPEQVSLPPPPHEVQLEALAALATLRTEDRDRALVVLATGLGKTLLAAFDWNALRKQLGRTPRLLFVAHREELLRQAARTFRRVCAEEKIEPSIGWFVGDSNNLSADLVFASVAKLGRQEHVAKLDPTRFDYVVVDEVHHAAAQSYRRILEKVEPTFILGLTATPDRADARDIEGFFDDQIAYRADVGRGVEIGRLLPFHYFGVKDDIDYENIPWRNRRFDPEQLAEAVQSDKRMETLWRAWNEHPGTRTLIFCCSIAHANFAKAWLKAKNVEVRAVYSAEGSDDREKSLKELAQGTVDAVCSVDVFNEGVDVVSVDRVVMLRPTESSVVFLQQLGRGLRKAAGKASLTIIDFVGNHRVFLERLRTLFSLGADTPNIAKALQADGHAELPGGCSVDLELEAKELLVRLFRVGGADDIERVYRELRAQRDERPLAGELVRTGYQLAPLRTRHGGWFEFVSAEEDLSIEEQEACEVHADFLHELETTSMSKSFKMITLEALLELDAMPTGASVRDLAIRAHTILRRSPDFLTDIPEEFRSARLNEKSWLAYWTANPIDAWTSVNSGRRTWFRVQDGRFRPLFTVSPVHEAAFTSLVREMVDARLAQYHRRSADRGGTTERFICRVTWNKRDPILKLPSNRAIAPEGETPVRVENGVWQFRFQKEFCNVARPVGAATNQLPDLLRRWFGINAGKPGTQFEVRFRSSANELWAEPVRADVVELDARRGIVAYPDLRAAAGHAMAATEDDELRSERVMLPVKASNDEVFAVRVSGSSMDGGSSPMRDGDWAVMALARGAAAASVEGRVVLVETPGESFGSQYQVKRLKRTTEGWSLTSDNPDGPTVSPSKEMKVIARLVKSFPPEALGPSVGTSLTESELAGAFHLEELASVSGRHGGHLFLFIDQKGLLEEPGRVKYPIANVRPSETAFVLARRDESFIYLGIGRSTGDGRWTIPEVDHATWREWGEERETSRRLPEGALERAQLVVEAITSLPESERWLVRNGNRAKVVGVAERGGLRIAGEDGNLKERTVSLNDLAWVIVADDDVRAQGGVLDESRVNLLRYLDGTPKESTRLIDTGWSIAAWTVGKKLAHQSAVAGELRWIKRDDGTQVDASFRVEPVGDQLTVVVESRGGTRGTSDERNTDYQTGFRLLLERLASMNVQINDAVVDSRDTAKLKPEERRLKLGARDYPLTIDNPETLRKELARAAAQVGRAEGARGGGNSTKRLRLFLSGNFAPGELANRLEKSQK